MKVTKKMLFLLSYVTAVSDWTREQAAEKLGMSETELDSIIERAQLIEYYEDGVVIPKGE